MKIYIQIAAIISFVLVVSCKSASNYTQSKDTVVAPEKITNIQKLQHYQELTPLVFNTLQINSDVEYTSKSTSQKVHAEINIEKDKFIHITIRFFGITMAKALLTPTEVKYYEKLGKTYYQGDYQSLSKWLAIPLDYKTVQNLVLGRAITEVTASNFDFEKTDSKITLTEKNNLTINHIFEYDFPSLNLNQQDIKQIKENRALHLVYSDWTTAIETQPIRLPKDILIEASQEVSVHTIALKHASLKINETVNDTYTVPNGYERIYTK